MKLILLPFVLSVLLKLNKNPKDKSHPDTDCKEELWKQETANAKTLSCVHFWGMGLSEEVIVH